MDDTEGMCGRQGVQNASQDHAGRFDRQAAAVVLQNLPQRRAFDQLHNQVRRLAERVDAQHADDVHMAQPAENLALLAQVPDVLRLGRKLDGRHVRPRVMPREPHLGERAVADRFFEHEFADAQTGLALQDAPPILNQRPQCTRRHCPGNGRPSATGLDGCEPARRPYLRLYRQLDSERLAGDLVHQNDLSLTVAGGNADERT